MYYVGVLYENGGGAPHDPHAAVPWFERAATQGDEQSKTRLHNLAAEGVPEAVEAARRLRLEP